MRPERSLDLQAVDDLRARSSLWETSRTIIGQRGRAGVVGRGARVAGCAGCPATACSIVAAMSSMHRGRVIAFDKLAASSRSP